MTSAKRAMASETPLNVGARSAQTSEILARLHKTVIGQVDAIEELAQCFVRFKAGLSPLNRPMGVFLFVGPTGTGKTHLTRMFAEAIGHPASSIIRIDCGEYMASHEAAKLLGSPPGYLGHRETAPILTQEVLTKQHTPEAPISIVLFDEIEKAHPAIQDVIMGVLGEARLRTGDNKMVDFCDTIIILTANLGASSISDALSPSWGLGRMSVPTVEEVRKAIASIGTRAARKTLKPEFFNRIDKILTFHPLSEAELAEILGLEIELLSHRLYAAQRPIELHITPDAFQFILHDGYDPRYGARHLKRSVARHLENPLANLLISQQIHPRDHIEIRLAGDHLEFMEM